MIAAVSAPTREPVDVPEPSQAERIHALSKTISASRLSCWLQCRLKFWFRYVEKLTKPRTAALHVGSVVHAVLQQWSLARWQHRSPDDEQIDSWFETSWTQLQQDESVSWKDKEASERDSARAALSHYLAETPVAADERPEAVEVRIDTDLAAQGLPTLVGVIDLVRPGGRIVDFKVTGKSPDPTRLAHLHELQLTCYSVLYRDATGQREAGFELHHLVRTKKPKLIVSSLAPATSRQHTRLFRQIESYQNGLDRQDIVPSPGFGCASCEYFKECSRWS